MTEYNYDKEIYDKVKKITTEQLSVTEDKIAPAKSFTDDLGADSIGLVELVMKLEDEFEINIPDEEAEKLKTFGDAVKYIQEHR